MSIRPMPSMPTPEWWAELRQADDSELHTRVMVLDNLRAASLKEQMVIHGELSRRTTARNAKEE